MILYLEVKQYREELSLNTKSDISGSIALVIIVLILLFWDKIINSKFLVIIVIGGLLYFCYETCKIIIRKEYRTGWIIAINNLIFIVVSIGALWQYLNTIALDSSQFFKKMTIVLVCSSILDKVLRIKGLKDESLQRV